MRLEIKNLNKTFNDLIIFKDVSVKIDNIHSLILIGPSGGGKTTLLRILAGLEKPDNGKIHINNHFLNSKSKFLNAYRKKIGMVFQAYNLFPHLTAIENIMLPLIKVHNMNKNNALDKTIKLLDRFDLLNHKDKKPSALSGGQQQRIAICRAVAINPEFLLLDEPTSALDPEYTSEVLDLINELKYEGMDLILVTHEMGFAKQLADYVFFISDEGITEHGSGKNVFERNNNKRVKNFLNKILKYN